MDFLWRSPVALRCPYRSSALQADATEACFSQLICRRVGVVMGHTRMMRVLPVPTAARAVPCRRGPGPAPEREGCHDYHLCERTPRGPVLRLQVSFVYPASSLCDLLRPANVFQNLRPRNGDRACLTRARKLLRILIRLPILTMIYWMLICITITMSNVFFHHIHTARQDKTGYVICVYSFLKINVIK